MAIQRLNLRDQVRRELVEWLSDGRLLPGQRLEEERLSRALGVSRTPLREALSNLASEGLVDAVPRRGFRVPVLAAALVRDLYPLIGGLEALALRLSGPRACELAGELDEINERIGLPHLSSRQRSEADRRWHEVLVSRNPNRELTTLLERTRARTRPYGGSWERNAAGIESSRSDHAEIAQLLKTGQVNEAAEAVLRHWVRGISVVTAWVDQGNR